MKQRLGLAIVLFCLMPALFAQQKVKQNAREDNASFMFTAHPIIIGGMHKS